MTSSTRLTCDSLDKGNHRSMYYWNRDFDVSFALSYSASPVIILTNTSTTQYGKDNHYWTSQNQDLLLQR